MYKIWKRLVLLKAFDTVENTGFAKNASLSSIQSFNHYIT